MAPCTTVLKPSAALPRATGETLRYLVDVDGVSMGTIDFKIEQRGTLDGKPVTEYRSLFTLDALVAAFVPVSGRAAAVVPDQGFWPIKAMNHYDLRNDVFDEEVTADAEGKSLTSKRSKNGQLKEASRRFNEPVVDFVTGFYLARSLPHPLSGCTVIYGNQRAYTIWLEPDGQESVQTPVGLRPADRYEVRYASERSQQVVEGRVWLAVDGARVPYRAEVFGPNHLVARIHMYETGTHP
jgi:hypothetical protein